MTQEYSIWTDVVEGSVIIRPYDPSLIHTLGEPASSIHFLKNETDDTVMSVLYMIEPYSYPGASGYRPTIIVDSYTFYQHFFPQLGKYHILGTVHARMEDMHDNNSRNLTMLFSSFTSDPARLSYVGTENPVMFPCDYAELETHHWLYYEPHSVDLSAKACLFLTELFDLRQLVQELVAVSLETSQEQQPLDQAVLANESARLVDVLNLEPEFVSTLVDLGQASEGQDLTSVDLLLYTVLLFQDGDVVLTFEPSGFLVSLRDDLRLIADEEIGFSSFIQDSVKQRENDDHVELTERLQIVSELIKDTTESITVKFYLANRFSNDYWQSVDIDESFYNFLWNINIFDSAYYEGNIYTTISRNPLINLDLSICSNNQYLAGYTELCHINWVEVIPFWAYTSPLITLLEVLPGGWGFWSEWGDCSQSCGGGIRIRQRDCVDVEAECRGQTTEAELCNPRDCDLFIDGQGELCLKNIKLACFPNPNAIRNHQSASPLHTHPRV